jgi:hypothetical protein
MKVPVDLLVYTHEEVRKSIDLPTSFIGHVMESGKVLYGKG